MERLLELPKPELREELDEDERSMERLPELLPEGRE